MDHHLNLVFEELCKHFDHIKTKCCHIDDSYFAKFTPDDISNMYRHMDSYTQNGIIICNIIFQHLKHSNDFDVIVSGIKAIDYQQMRGDVNDDLWNLVRSKKPYVDISKLDSTSDDMYMLIEFFKYML